jgi:phosphatidate phosphatase APP1
MKRFFHNILHYIKRVYNAIHFRLKSLLGLWTKVPVRIDDYGGFARTDYLYLKGRVLADRFITNTNQDSVWRIFLNNYRRFGSREIQGAVVEVEFGENTFEVRTDMEGYFIVDQELSSPIEEQKRMWQRAFCRVIRTPWQEVDVHQITEILVLPDHVQKGVISDIDDTILRTELKSLFKWRAIYLTFLKSAAGRQVFQHAPAFYQKLKEELNPGGQAPFFYVSKSPWNLHDVLVDFIKLNKFPVGPIFLRDIGLPHEKRPRGYLGHKHVHIRKIMDTFPHIQFVLIGDIMEADPRIYLDIAQHYPGRVPAIYLRDVGSEKKRKKFQKLLRENPVDVPVCLFKSYEEGEAHATSAGLVGDATSQ